jgi:tripartite-type tricarboxylate transporter receptor subunit TctC
MGTRILLVAIVALGIAMSGAPAAAQSYPDRLIKIVVPYPPAGPADVAARLVAQPLASQLGQRVIVENLPGAGGRTGMKAVARASADGYTLFLGGTNPNALVQALFHNLDFEPIRDFAAVALIGYDSNALVVNPAVPAKTLAELVAYSKANPGKLTSGATVGISPHICLELFRVKTGSSIVYVPYKGAAPALADLLGGQIQVGMTSKAVLLPYIRDGKLRALAVTSDVRWPELPEVPTFRESGIAEVPAYIWIGLLAPARTPAAVIDKLNAAVIDGLKVPELQAAIAKLGMETRSMTAQEFGRTLTAEAVDWQAAVEASGVKLE